MIVWDRDDYLKEVSKQLEHKEVYLEVPNDSSAEDTLNYFLVKDPKLERFYLLPKVHKRVYDAPGRPVISNCGFYTENISSFLDFHLQPLAQELKSYIKGTNHFLRKI